MTQQDLQSHNAGAVTMNIGNTAAKQLLVDHTYE
jgi:hypothetical protein